MVTRRDLSPGYQATQAAHAALTFSIEHPDICRTWHDDSNYLIVLATEDESALEALAKRAEAEGIQVTRFNEPDLDDELTAIVIAPSDVTCRLTSNLPLALRASREVVAA